METRIKVRFLAALSTLLIILTFAPFCAAQSGAESALNDPSPASMISISAEANDWIITTLETLSPLPIMALGIFGLLWIRRHTSEL